MSYRCLSVGWDEKSSAGVGKTGRRRAICRRQLGGCPENQSNVRRTAGYRLGMELCMKSFDEKIVIFHL